MLSVFKSGSFAPCPAQFNMAEHILAAGLVTPDKTALSVLKPDGSEDWTYSEIRQAVLGTAQGFLASGLVAGDRLLFRVGNCVEFPVAYLAAIAVGIVPIPTSSQLTAIEASKLLEIVSPHAILSDGSTPCPNSGLPVLTTGNMRGWFDNKPASFERGDPNRLAYIIFTSGTSGTPRAVMHAHRAIWARQMMFDGWYGLTKEDRILHAGAFNWTYTLGTGLMDPWTMGATALIPGTGVAHSDVPDLLTRYGATIFAAAPGVYRNVLKASQMQFPKLRHGLSAGEKLSPNVRAQWTEATGTPIFEAFGMSECSTFISSSPQTPLVNEVALGRPQSGRGVALLDENGPVDVGTPGVISISENDPGLTLGYFGAEQASRDKFQDGWFRTGDLGVMDDNGEISYLGRADDMMNAGGFRVSPVEVEAAMSTHPGIVEAAATDIEIKPGVRVIALFYTGPVGLPDEELADWAQARLARYKQPRIFKHLDALPRNANGKVLRRTLCAN